MGRLTADVELRYTPQNTAVGSFTLAVDRGRKDANGERETDFIKCVTWGKTAENLAAWCKRGGRVGITGRIQTRNYENKAGQRVHVTEVVVNSFENLESRAERESQGQYGGASQGQRPAPQDSNPFGRVDPLDLSDEDLPF